VSQLNSWRSYAANVIQIGGETWTAEVKKITSLCTEECNRAEFLSHRHLVRQTFVRNFYEKCYENPSISFVGLQILTVPTNEQFYWLLRSCDRAS